MSTITIGSKFFRNEARGYGSPAQGFWRELIQNAVDNGASRIDIQTRCGEDRDVVNVSFVDNGTGMSRSILENVYFCLGETTKGGADEIGGFGRARLLTCFAQEAYTIRTQNLTVVGAGSEYDIEETEGYVNGCEFEIDVHLPTLRVPPFYGHQSSDERLVERLCSYLSKCQFGSIEITINGERFTNYLLKRQKRGDLTFGTIHVVKKPAMHGGMIFVRVRGALMFEKNLYGSSALVIVEINPENSRDVLVSNRDSLNYQYEQELDSLIQSLAVNNLSGLNERKSETIIAAGGYRNVAIRDLSTGRKKKQVFEEKSFDEQVFEASQFIASSNDEEEILTTHTDRGYHSDVPRARMGGGSLVLEHSVDELLQVPTNIRFYAGDSEDVLPVEIDSITQGMYYVLDSSDARIRIAARKWQERYLAAKGPGRKRRKLLAQWIVACEWAISAFSQVEDSSVIETWAPGVYFKDTALAGYQQGSESKSHAFLFNPLDNQGRIRYDLDSMEDHAEMLASAAHEVCHAAYEGHNEGFARVLTNVMGSLFPHIAQIHREMKLAG